MGAVDGEAQGGPDVCTPSSPNLAPNPQPFLGHQGKGQRPYLSPAEKLGRPYLGKGWIPRGEGPPV